MDPQQLQIDLQQIKERNARVEADKAWEISQSRKIIILVLTFLVVLLVFYFNNMEKPLWNALIATVAFWISTLSVSAGKKLWLKYTYKK
ncbi:hypothetical protein HY933_00765 [Candidatus Falkowbacteria bacterium]|nr:hypothetical protein [Candidatus Falkowbacteria bacterium]